MIIDCISDLHGSHPKLEGGDLLIVAGDLTARDEPDQHFRFWLWAANQQYKQVVVIAGNHDGYLQENPNAILVGAHLSYLCDQYIEFQGLKIWGAPWTPPFFNWHFMLPPEEIKLKWDMIPEDTDILVTHGPSYGILDNPYKIPSSKHDRCGCPHLREAVERVKPRLHVFGHIHGSYGTTYLKHQGEWEPNKAQTICVNAAHMNEDYLPVNAPIRIVL
jgi:Icc-related predicted phosphoesterase